MELYPEPLVLKDMIFWITPPGNLKRLFQWSSECQSRNNQITPQKVEPGIVISRFYLKLLNFDNQK
jgi:hypothetical protein